MSDLYDLGHAAQLHEIQRARLRRGESGIGPMVEELIRRLTDGGVAGNTRDIRVAQAKRYWDLGVGRKLGFASFEAYLTAIPEIPAALLQDDPEFPILLLVEPRLGLKKLCGLVNLAFDGDDKTFVVYRGALPVLAWIRVQDGRRNRYRSACACRKSFGRHEIGLTALQGVCLYVQNPGLWSDLSDTDGHALDLAGSVKCDITFSAACLIVRSGRAWLDWHVDDDSNVKFGSASCRV